MSIRVGVGLVGAGWIARVHAEQYLRVAQLCPLPGVELSLHAVSDVIPELAESLALAYGFARTYENWEDLVADPAVTLVDICVPNALHRDIAVASVAKGKDVFCEKPMSTSADEGRAMFEAAEAAGVRHMVNFNYRRTPAIAFAKQLLSEKELGDIYHFRGGFTQDFGADLLMPWSWRFNAAAAGGGSLVTMGSHVIDCARYLVGDLSEMVAMQNTFVVERPLKGGGIGQVDVDDSSSAMIRFSGGATGLLYTTWLAHGRKHHFEWEINASRGSLVFNSERLNELQVCEASQPKDRQGFKTVYVGEQHPYGHIFGLKSGMGIGIRETFLLQTFELLRGIAKQSAVTPSFYDGWQVDRVLEGATKSAAERRWVKL